MCVKVGVVTVLSDVTPQPRHLYVTVYFIFFISYSPMRYMLYLHFTDEGPEAWQCHMAQQVVESLGCACQAPSLPTAASGAKSPERVSGILALTTLGQKVIYQETDGGVRY